MTRRDADSTDHPVEYDPETRTYTAHHGGKNEESLSHTIVETVAAATGADPTGVQQLYEVVDPDALNQLFGPSVGDGCQSVDGHVAFRFEGCDVTVHSDGRTVVSTVEHEPR